MRESFGFVIIRATSAHEQKHLNSAQELLSLSSSALGSKAGDSTLRLSGPPPYFAAIPYGDSENGYQVVSSERPGEHEALANQAKASREASPKQVKIFQEQHYQVEP